MNPAHFGASCLVLLAILCLPASAPAGDWPQWGGSDGRNIVSAEKNLPATFKTGKTLSDVKTATNVRWVARLGSNAFGNVTVAAGRVFVGTDDATLSTSDRLRRTRGGMVKCFSEADGTLIWQLVVPRRTGIDKKIHYSQQHLGVCSSPTVDGDRVYVVTSAGEIVCLDAHGLANGNGGAYQDEARYIAGRGKKPVKLADTDADILWVYDLIDDGKIAPHDVTSCSVLIHGDLLYTSTSNGVDGPHKKMVLPEAPAFIALDKHTGKLVAYENAGISPRMWHAQWCSPSLGKVGGRTLIFLGGGDGICYAFEAMATAPKGKTPTPMKLVWRYDCNPPSFRLRDGKEIPYYEGDRRKKWSTNKNDGTYLGPSQIIATPVFHNNRIYVAIGQDPAHGRGRGLLHCIDPTKTGDITKTGCIWTYDKLERSMATVSIADGSLYIADIAGRLHCLDADTGKGKWHYDMKAETWGGALLADGKAYIGTKKELFVFAMGDEPKVLCKMRLGSPLYSTPVAANGTVYVASQRYLWAVAKTK